MSEDFFSPFGLRERVTYIRPWLFLGFVPFVNVLLLGLGMILLGSMWLCPPGIKLQLPKTEENFIVGTKVDFVLTVAEGNKILFKRKLYDENVLKHLFKDPPPANNLLLIKVDETITVGFMVKVIEAAKGIGFRNIQLATESR